MNRGAGDVDKNRDSPIKTGDVDKSALSLSLWISGCLAVSMILASLIFVIHTSCVSNGLVLIMTDDK